MTAEAEAKPTPAVVQRVGEARDWLRAAIHELGKVTWPSREELIKATRMIVVLSVALGVVIGLMDWLLNLILVDGVAALTRR
ncbi:MAG TPA: preprotein translocase subunit SecE [Gemmatimonadales bacterium]|nr:preprotein translocase subunit SecE [Gemmatimonadales bacterium]